MADEHSPPRTTKTPTTTPTPSPTPPTPTSTPSPTPPTPTARIPDRTSRPSWTLLTNHGHVLLVVAQGGDVRISDIAARVGITERATLMILKDLEDGGYITRRKVGRRTHYTVDEHQHFRHPTLSAHEIGELLTVLGPAQDPQDPAISSRESRPSA